MSDVCLVFSFGIFRTPSFTHQLGSGMSSSSASSWVMVLRQCVSKTNFIKLWFNESSTKSFAKSSAKSSCRLEIFEQPSARLSRQVDPVNGQNSTPLHIAAEGTQTLGPWREHLRFFGKSTRRISKESQLEGSPRIVSRIVCIVFIFAWNCVNICRDPFHSHFIRQLRIPAMKLLVELGADLNVPQIGTQPLTVLTGRLGNKLKQRWQVYEVSLSHMGMGQKWSKPLVPDLFPYFGE